MRPVPPDHPPPPSAPDAVPPELLRAGIGGIERRLAFRRREGTGPRLVWLGGYASDMAGTKALALDGLARDVGQAFLRLDYSGHGASGGRFVDGTISSWTDDAAAVIDHAARGEAVILVGSSMGAWIALRLALAWREAPASPRLAGLLFLAPAPDFTGRLVEPGLSEADRRVLAEEGALRVPSLYSPEPTLYTRALLEDGRRCAVMDRPIRLDAPVRILQGMADPDVPFAHALDLAALMPFDDVVLTLVRDGDHRLSRASDIARMLRAAGELIEAAGTR